MTSVMGLSSSTMRADDREGGTMATPMTPVQWTAALKAEGVHADYWSGWTTRGRDAATGKAFGPVNGVMIHHTAGTNSLKVILTGRSDLPGPLAHAHLAKSGTLTMISVHRANHAGTVAQNAYDAVVGEDSLHPRPAVAEPVDGNDHFYGIEIENKGNGTDPYPAIQLDQAVRWTAAICRHHGWSADSVIGHKEATRRKIDPSFSMESFRTKVAQRLTHPASWSPGDTTAEEKPVAQTESETFRGMWKTDGLPVVVNGVNTTWTGAEYFADTRFQLKRAHEKLDAIMAHLGITL